MSKPGGSRYGSGHKKTSAKTRTKAGARALKKAGAGRYDAVAPSGNGAAGYRPSRIEIPRDRMIATQFPPKTGKGAVSFIQKPRLPQVRIARKALDKMSAYVGLMNTEIGWMATVEQDAADVYTITDCYLLEQEVSPVTTEIGAQGIGQLVQELIEQDPVSGVEIANKLRCWGHSHVDMGTTPSDQDERQMKRLAEDVDDFMIRLIANKRGDIRIDVFDYERGLVFSDIGWSHAEKPENPLLEEIADEIEGKVTMIGSRARSSTVTTPRSGHRSYYRGLDDDGLNDDGLDNDGLRDEFGLLPTGYETDDPGFDDDATLPGYDEWEGWDSFHEDFHEEGVENEGEEDPDEKERPGKRTFVKIV